MLDRITRPTMEFQKDGGDLRYVYCGWIVSKYSPIQSHSVLHCVVVITLSALLCLLLTLYCSQCFLFSWKEFAL
jgi:hypothetical protein